jgi:hypothetical protein
MLLLLSKSYHEMVYPKVHIQYIINLPNFTFLYKFHVKVNFDKFIQILYNS